MNIAKQDLRLRSYNNAYKSSLNNLIDTHNTIMRNRNIYRENITRLYINKINNIKDDLQKQLDALVNILNHLEDIQSNKSTVNTDLYECKKDYKDTMDEIKNIQEILAKID